MPENENSIYELENQNIEQEQQEIEYIEEITIVTRGVDFSVRELKTMIEESELVVPDFQRELVWDSRRKSRFIESILLGYPIPGMFFTDLDKGKMMIIDGQQRINTLVEFLNNEMKILNREDINPKWRNKFYRDIDDDSRAKLRSSNIRASVFRILSEDDEEKNMALYSLFERINTGSIQLNSQEIRRAIYFSEYVKALNEFVEKESWVMSYRAVDESEVLTVPKDKRLNDQEIISRILTLEKLLENKLNSDISYKKEINKFMSSVRNIKEDEANDLLNSIEKRLIWLQNNISFNVGFLFRKPVEVYKNTPELKELEKDLSNKKFNIPLFEAIVLNLKTDQLKNTRFDQEKYLQLFTDDRFLTSISKQTNKQDNIKYRMEKVQEVFPIG